MQLNNTQIVHKLFINTFIVKIATKEALTGVEKTLIEREKEIEQLQEKISLMNIQQLKETSIILSMCYIILT